MYVAGVSTEHQAIGCLSEAAGNNPFQLAKKYTLNNEIVLITITIVFTK